MPQSFCEAVIALTPKPDKGNGKKKKYRAISCMKYRQKFNVTNGIQQYVKRVTTQPRWVNPKSASRLVQHW